jgi:enoyl-CoA hydratase/carnithine racemase
MLSADHFLPRRIAFGPSLNHMASNRLSQIQNHLIHQSSLVITSYSSDHRVVTITINHAARANCLSTPVLQALLDALKSINPRITLHSSIDSEDPIAFAERVCHSHAPNPVPKVVILKSNGKIFSSGHDLKEFHAAKGDYKKIHEIFELCNTVMLTIRRLPQIVISQV